MMIKKLNHLTNSEEDLMEIFWERKEPLTSVEIEQLEEIIEELKSEGAKE